MTSQTACVIQRQFSHTPCQKSRKRTMWLHYPLRVSCRTRCVYHVSQTIRSRHADITSLLIASKHSRKKFRCNDNLGFTIFHHVLNTICRIFRVNRNISRSNTLNSQDAGKEFFLTWQLNTNKFASLYTLLKKISSNSSRLLIQLLISKAT